MRRSVLLRAGVRAIIAAILLTLLFAGGVGTGLLFQPLFSSNVSGDSGHEDPDSHADGAEEPHVALSREAFENLGLRIGPPTRGDYWKSTLTPGKVVEIPGRSDLAVSAPVTGVIESLNIVPGESIPSQKTLFTIRVTDESILAAQTKYLDMLTQEAVTNQEIERLAPLIRSGAVTGTKKRDLEYKATQLAASQATLLQELRARGLPESHLQKLIRNKELSSTITVETPGFIAEDITADRGATGYSIENIHVHPGKAVTRGESLCSIAFHRRLYIEGLAFGTDLPILQRIANEQWKISIELEHEPEPGAPDHELSLELLRVDNHVDEATQMVRFFIDLPNKTTRSLTDGGRRFEQWQFRPGQRLHLRLPVERWKDQLTLPVDAVVIDGPDAFVFVEHHHEDAKTTGDGHDHAHSHDHAGHEEPEHKEDTFIELAPVPVRLLHRDDKTAVIARGGGLHDKDQVALNNAYKLYLAMQMKSSSGDKHHGHDH